MVHNAPYFNGAYLFLDCSPFFNLAGSAYGIHASLICRTQDVERLLCALKLPDSCSPYKLSFAPLVVHRHLQCSNWNTAQAGGISQLCTDHICQRGGKRHVFAVAVIHQVQQAYSPLTECYLRWQSAVEATVSIQHPASVSGQQLYQL